VRHLDVSTLVEPAAVRVLTMSSTTGQVSLAAVGRSALILTGAAFVVQAIGFVRQLFLAAEIGISAELDALLIALAAPLAASAVLVAGVGVALVPAYTHTRAERSLADARRLAGTVVSWTLLASLGISAVLWVFAEQVIALTGPGLAEEGSAADAVLYLRMLTPLTALSSMTAILSAVCQAESLFPSMAAATVTGPAITLGITVYAWEALGLDGLVIGTLVGTTASLLLMLGATIWRGVAPLPRVVSRGVGIGALARHAVPLSLSSAILHVNQIVGRALASWFTVGGVSALSFGESLVKVPFGAIQPAWNTALYPALVRAERDPGERGLAVTTERVLRYALAFFVPLAALTVAVAPVATAVAYDRGSFDSDDLALTAQVVAVSAPLIVLWTVAPTLVAALNARRAGTALLVASGVNVVVNVAFNLIFGLLFGVVGIAIATSTVAFIMVVYLARRLAREEPTFSLGSLTGTFLRALLAILPASLLFGAPIWAGLVDGDLWLRLGVLVVVGVAGLGSYALIAPRIGLSETTAIITFGIDSTRRIVRRVTRR
jgi:putative peptidoglycan lipid II flippase